MVEFGQVLPNSATSPFDENNQHSFTQTPADLIDRVERDLLHDARKLVEDGGLVGAERLPALRVVGPVDLGDLRAAFLWGGIHDSPGPGTETTRTGRGFLFSGNQPVRVFFRTRRCFFHPIFADNSSEARIRAISTKTLKTTYTEKNLRTMEIFQETNSLAKIRCLSLRM